MPRPREFDIDTVLKQSMTVFWAQGYKSTSMEDLMKATRLNKQSFYCAFGDKRSLYLQALALYGKESMSKLRGIVDTTESALATLERMLRAKKSCPETGAAIPTGCMLVKTAMEFGETDEVICQELNRVQQNLITLIAEVIDKGQQQGEITRRFDSVLIAKSLINTLSGLKIMENRGESPEETGAVLRIALASFHA